MKRRPPLRVRLEGLVEADAEAFVPLAKAYSIPKEDPAQAGDHGPGPGGRRCGAPGDHGVLLPGHRPCWKNTRTRAVCWRCRTRAAGRCFCRAALEGAGLNVSVNTRLMADRSRAEELDAKAAAMLEEYVPRAEAVVCQGPRAFGRKLKWHCC